MKKYKLLFTVFLLIILSCNEKEFKKEYKIFDFKSYQILLPNNWKEIKIKGIDSEVNAIITDKNDTILFDYGKFSNYNNEVVNVVDIKEYKKLDSLGFPVKEMYFSKIPDIDKNQGTFHKEFYYYDTIDVKVGKVRVPKVVGKGITSISFDSINNTNERLYISGENLDSLNQFEFIKSFKTIKFK